MTFMNLQPHQTDTIAAFGHTAEQYAASIGSLANYNSTYDALLDLLPAESHVLDLACGPGNVSRYLVERKPLRITGFDLAEPMLQLARRHIPTGHFEKRSLLELAGTGPFDTIVNAFGIPFLDRSQRVACFAGMASALRNGGLLYISFMEGDHAGFERTAFSPDREIYFHYHRKAEVLQELCDLHFELLQEWKLDFVIGNGAVLEDNVMILRYTNNNAINQETV